MHACEFWKLESNLDDNNGRIKWNGPIDNSYGRKEFRHNDNSGRIIEIGRIDNQDFTNVETSTICSRNHAPSGQQIQDEYLTKTKQRLSELDVMENVIITISPYVRASPDHRTIIVVVIESEELKHLKDIC